jgi:hypothetical protein
MNALGKDLVNKVNRCSLENGRITVTADSSAWAARIRFALAEAEPQLQARLAEVSPGFRELVVRVRPRKSDLP